MTRNTSEFQEMLKDIEAKHLSETDGESQVQEKYNSYFTNYFKLTTEERIKRVCRCDAYFSKDGLNLLIEYKFDKDFRNTESRAKVIAQVIAYYKLILDKNEVPIPNMVFVGDVNECFAFHINRINSFLAIQGIDWSVAPHEFGERNDALVKAIISDRDINEKIFISNPQHDDMEKICKNIVDMSKGEYRFIAVNESTIRSAYDHFLNKVVREDLSTRSRKSSEIVGIFIESIKDPANRTIQNGLLQTPSFKAIKVDESEARRYFNHFGKRNDNEAKELSRYADFLENDTERRFKGFFITPRPFVLSAYKLIEKHLGESWAQNFMVIDPCCGTKALTRELRFGELWLSTIDESELSASKDVNKEWLGHTFLFDFLNDPDSKCIALSQALSDAVRSGKKVLFLMNPPYAQPTSEQGNQSKDLVSTTIVKQMMATEGMGKAGNEVFVQFLYKIDLIRRKYRFNDDNIYIGTFSNPSWLCNESFEMFRKRWLERWMYKDGFAFVASEFEDTEPNWGISFSLWINRETPKNERNTFKHMLLENDDDNITEALPTEKGSHTLYNIDGEQKGNEWAKGKRVYSHKCIATTDGFKMKHGTRGSSSDDALGYFSSNSNNIDQSARYAYLLSMASTRSNGYPITEENFDRVCALFCARRVVSATWYNCKDPYRKPDTNNQYYSDYQKDSYILSIFENQAKQTSVKGDCDGEHYDFKNQFYPFSKKETYEMLGEDWLLNDKDEQRYILSSGKLNDLTEEGKVCLSAYRSCFLASKNQRPEYSAQNPKYQLDRWDCGYFQQKDFFEKACPAEHKELKKCIKALADKMRPMVYELGFLRK